jgi:hypothetical protein
MTQDNTEDSGGYAKSFFLCSFFMLLREIETQGVADLSG